MPAISNERRWRTFPQSFDYYVYLHQPTVIFRARIPSPIAVSYPLAEIQYDTVTVGAYTDIQPGMTIHLGSAAGSWDYGVQRIRKAADASKIYVGWSSQGRYWGELDIKPGAYIEVLDLREVWSRIPRILDDGTMYKDYDLDFATYGEEPPPVSNGGIGYAEFISGSTITVPFADQGSFATVDGGSISSRAWSFPGGTPSSSTSANPGNVTFPAGFRYCSYTVTDNNANTHTSYIPVMAAEKTGANAPIKCQITGHQRRVNGQSISIRLLEDAPETTYFPGTLAMIWARERQGKVLHMNSTTVDTDATLTTVDTTSLYTGMGVSGTGIPGGTTILSITNGTTLEMSANATASGTVSVKFTPATGSLSGVSGREHMVFVGWTDTEQSSFGMSQFGIRSDTVISLVDIAGRLDKLAGFPQEIRRKTTPTKWTEAKISTYSANIPRYVHYLLHWHSTALELADFTWDGDEYTFSWLESDGQSIWQQAAQRCEAIGYLLTCNRLGQLKMKPDPQLQVSGDRTAVVQVNIQADDWKQIGYTYTQAPRQHWHRGAALLITTGDAETEVAETVFSVAPGKAPTQGPGESNQNYQLVLDATEHYEREGRRYRARQNAQFGAYEVEIVENNEGGIDPAELEWVTLTASSTQDDYRGRSLSSVRFLPIEVSFEYSVNGIRRQRVALEREVLGDISAIDDPQLAIQDDILGEWGDDDWGWSQVEPIIDTGLNFNFPPDQDWGDEEIYDPEVDMPTPTGISKGVMYLLVHSFGVLTEWRIVRASWKTGTLTFTDISPNSTRRTVVGEVSGFHLDPYNYKRMVVLGRNGYAYTNDVTATTPTWVAATTGMTDEIAGGFQPALNRRNTFFWLSKNGDNLMLNRTLDAFQTITSKVAGKYVGTMAFSVSVSPHNWRDVWVTAGVESQEEYQDGEFAPKYVDFRNGLPAGWVLNFGTFNSNGLNAVSLGGGYYGCSVSYTYTSNIGYNRSYYWTDFANYGWVGPRFVHVYLHDANDTLLLDASTQYSHPMGDWSFITGSGSSQQTTRKVTLEFIRDNGDIFYFKEFVIENSDSPQGNPNTTTPYILRSTNGGDSFTPHTELYTNGGPVWWNWSTSTPNEKNTNANNIMIVRGDDASNIVFKQGTGADVNITATLADYPQTEHALGANARDMDYVFYAARTGKFYTSSDAGATWTPGTDIPGGTSKVIRGWWQYPKDRNFAVGFGYRVFAYTTDSGANWTNVQGSYDTWRSSTYGGIIGEQVRQVLIDRVELIPTPVTG